MADDIELRHLKYFLAVADTLHFTRAAEKLGIAQPPLSQQIQRLEAMLGHALFERTTRGVKLTAAGELLQQRAASTLAKMGDDLERVRRVGRGEEGTLTVGFSGSVMLTRLPEVIARFQKRYPRVLVKLREAWTASQAPALRDGGIDIGLMRDGEPGDGIVVETLLQESYVAALPAKHKLAAKKTLRVQELEGEPFILFSRAMGGLAFDRTMACCEAEGFRPQIAQEAPQWNTALRLVGAGLGVTLVPACMKKMVVEGTVYRDLRSAARTTVDLAHGTATLTSQAQNFVAMLRGRLG